MVDDSPLNFIVNKSSFEETGIYSGESLFNIFSFPVIQRNSKDIFDDVNSITISQMLAEKYFGNSRDALGKKIILRRTDQRKEVYVSAVFENVPLNSSLKFNYVLPLNSALKERPWLNSWQNYSTSTFLELSSNRILNFPFWSL